MVTVSCKHIRKKPVPQASQELSPEAHKIKSSTVFDFQGKGLTPYGTVARTAKAQTGCLLDVRVI